MKYHDYIPKGIQVTERTRICIKKHQKGDNPKSMKANSLIFKRHRSTLPVLHNIEISSKYFKRFSSYRAVTKMLTDGRTDARPIAISPEPFGRGITTIASLLFLASRLQYFIASKNNLLPNFGGMVSQIYASLFNASFYDLHLSI